MSAADQMLSAFRETSKSHVAAQPGSFIGVVLQKPAPDDANGLPVWSTYAFPTLEALTSWYDDWVGTPALYGYLAAIDRSRSSDEPIFEAGAGARIASGHDRVGARHIADAPGPRAMEYGSYDRLRDLIAQHETFWSEVMQRHPDSDLMKWWMQERWDPFFANWTDLIAHGISKVDIDVIGDQFNYLNGLRQEAHQHQIPLPPASDPAMTAVVVGAAVGSAVAISPRSDQVKQIVDLHNVFFLERAALDAAAGRSSTAQFVENEWAPWFSRWSDATADGGPLTEQLVREVARDLSKLRSSAATQGLAVPDIGSAGPRTPTIGYPHPPGEDPLVAQMNRETNERFWRETGYKPGQKLNPRDPADAEMIPRWLSIRYQIAQETNRATEPGAQVAQVAQVSGGHGHHGGGGGGGRRRRGYGGGGWGGGWYGDGYGWDDGDVLIDQVDGDVVIQGDRRPIALMGRWGTEPRRERRMAPRIMPHGGGRGLGLGLPGFKIFVVAPP